MIPVTLAGVQGIVCLKDGQFSTDANPTPEQYVQMLQAYNLSRGLDKDHAYKLSVIGASDMAATTVPEEDYSNRHKHCLACGLNFFPPRNRTEEPFCSQTCATKGWTKQLPPAGVRPAMTQPIPIVPARP